MAATPPPLPEPSGSASVFGPLNEPLDLAEGRAVAAGAAQESFAEPAGTGLEIEWRGSPWGLAWLGLINALLTVATLGFYSFWGKTEVRRRIWSSVRLNGEPLRYNGTGKELMLGFLAVFGVVLLPVLAITVAVMITFGHESRVTGAVQGMFYLVFFVLIAIATYRARRYRLSRTTWRGIRGTMAGSSSKYALASFATLFLYPLTLGWIAPWRATMLQRRLTRETVLGDKRLVFDGTSRPLYARYAIVWVGTLLIIVIALSGVALWLGPKLTRMIEAAVGTGPRQSLGLREIAGIAGIMFGAIVLWSIISAWYRASMANHFAASTRYEDARFVLAVGPGGLIWLFLSNLVLVLLSVGILKPVAEARAMRYFIKRLTIEGPLDLAGIGQNDAPFGGTGEGLAQAFNVDAF